MAPLTTEELRHEEFGHRKRCYGNAHNKSTFRLDYNDDPQFKWEFTTPDGNVRFGAGYGLKTFDTADHLTPDSEGMKGTEKYTDYKGEKLAKKTQCVPPHMDPKNKSRTPDTDGFVGNPDGSCTRLIRSKSMHAKIDHLEDGYLDYDAPSESSNTVGLVGARRKTDLIRPRSARRFPQKDFEKVTPRSVTPRPPSTARTPIKERPLWKK